MCPGLLPTCLYSAIDEHFQDFVTYFANCATVFRAIFPSEEERLTEVATKLFDEWVLLRSSLVTKFLEVVEWSSRNWWFWWVLVHSPRP